MPITPFGELLLESRPCLYDLETKNCLEAVVETRPYSAGLLLSHKIHAGLNPPLRCSLVMPEDMTPLSSVAVRSTDLHLFSRSAIAIPKAGIEVDVDSRRSRRDVQP